MQEGVHNLSIIARNPFENSTASYVTIETMGILSEMEVSDYNQITTIDEEKTIYIDFNPLPAETCIVMDFNDGVQRAYGYKEYCDEWAPGVQYDPDVSMEDPVIIKHPYS